MDYELGKIYELPVDELIENPNQPRTSFDEVELESLKESIDKYGLLQPILVKKDVSGKVVIVSGERRYRAFKALNKTTIPAWFTDGDEEELALIENLVRDDLSYMETSNALKKLESKFADQKELAKVIGKSQSLVSEIISLQRLPDDFKTAILGKKEFALRRLKTIAVCKNKDKQEKLCAEYLKQVQKGGTDKKRDRAKGKELVAKKLKAMLGQMTRLEAHSKATDANEQINAKFKKAVDAIGGLIKEFE
ncbi:MAG: ParB/RepB/Spo0J family partition protein [Spartobacteria bacterium]|nr:ParB/RepB/Spo0J family partition protein [Spartobacteria bacterium]